jgi:hypothetical protein
MPTNTKKAVIINKAIITIPKLGRIWDLKKLADIINIIAN